MQETIVKRKVGRGGRREKKGEKKEGRKENEKRKRNDRSGRVGYFTIEEEL